MSEKLFSTKATPKDLGGFSVKQARIEQSKHDWSKQKMGQVPGETEFIPLPTS